MVFRVYHVVVYQSRVTKDLPDRARQSVEAADCFRTAPLFFYLVHIVC